jgi:hypothetical protein
MNEAEIFHQARARTTPSRTPPTGSEPAVANTSWLTSAASASDIAAPRHQT